jgi:RNA polymerase sigma-70 factor (ECF subfamily)
MTKPSFEALVDAHGGEVFAYLCRLTRDEDDARDCLQEAFLRACRAYPRVETSAPGRGNLRAWLYRIATNVAFTHLRRRRRERAWHTGLDEVLPDGASPPPDQAARKILLARLAAAVEGLPVQQRSALVLRQYQELSYAEVAEVLGCTEAAARANVYQALKKLREKFADDAEIELPIPA